MSSHYGKYKYMCWNDATHTLASRRWSWFWRYSLCRSARRWRTLHSVRFVGSCQGYRSSRVWNYRKFIIQSDSCYTKVLWNDIKIILSLAKYFNSILNNLWYWSLDLCCSDNVRFINTLYNVVLKTYQHCLVMKA